VITGATAKGSPNSFLCTEKEYGDFVLEFDVMTDPALNSGVQIRSHRYPEEKTVTVFDGKRMVQRKQPKGRVHGYQVEIANEKAAQVRFRNLRIQDLGRHVWKPLWDGRTLSGWQPRGGAAWVVEDSAIHAKSRPDDGNIGALVSDASFKDLTLRVRFKMIKGN